MKSDLLRKFLHLSKRDDPMLWDSEIALLPREYYAYNKQIRCEHSFVFDIVERNTAKIVGEIALRIGDSPELFYLGHIGYHIDPPFRGHSYAAKACSLCGAMLRAFDMQTVIITTDPDNMPSIKTCVRLGCELESTVKVPALMMDRLEISSEKHRFLWYPGR